MKILNTHFYLKNPDSEKLQTEAGLSPEQKQNMDLHNRPKKTWLGIHIGAKSPLRALQKSIKQQAGQRQHNHIGAITTTSNNHPTSSSDDKNRLPIEIQAHILKHIPLDELANKAAAAGMSDGRQFLLQIRSALLARINELPNHPNKGDQLQRIILTNQQLNVTDQESMLRAITALPADVTTTAINDLPNSRNKPYVLAQLASALSNISLLDPRKELFSAIYAKAENLVGHNKAIVLGPLASNIACFQGNDRSALFNTFFSQAAAFSNSDRASVLANMVSRHYGLEDQEFIRQFSAIRTAANDLTDSDKARVLVALSRQIGDFPLPGFDHVTDEEFYAICRATNGLPNSDKATVLNELAPKCWRARNSNLERINAVIHQTQDLSPTDKAEIFDKLSEDICHISDEENQIKAFRAIHAQVSTLPNKSKESILNKLHHELWGILSKKTWDEHLTFIYSDAYNFSEWRKVSLFEEVAHKIRRTIPPGENRDHAMNEVRQAATSLPSVEAREAIERALHGVPNFIMVEPSI